jgi:hypothetical protein
MAQQSDKLASTDLLAHHSHQTALLSSMRGALPIIPYTSSKQTLLAPADTAVDAGGAKRGMAEPSLHDVRRDVSDLRDR